VVQQTTTKNKTKQNKTKQNKTKQKKIFFMKEINNKYVQF
jgi:hypothetical protein